MQKILMRIAAVMHLKVDYRKGASGRITKKVRSVQERLNR